MGRESTFKSDQIGRFMLLKSKSKYSIKTLFLLFFAIVIALSMFANPLAAFGDEIDVTLEIEKFWDDDDNAAGARPSSIEVDIFRSSDANRTGEAFVKTVTLYEANEWRIRTSVKGSDSYYYIKEKSLPEGYSSSDSATVKPIEVILSDNIWEDPREGNPLGSGGRFNVIAFGDFIANNADVEGGLAVQGDFTSPARQSYTIGLPAFADGSFGAATGIGYPIAPHDPRLIVGGALSVNQDIEVYGGSVYLADLNNVHHNANHAPSYIKLQKYIGSDSTYSNETPHTDFEQFYWPADPASAALVVENPDIIAAFFSATQSFMNAKSNEWFSLASSSDTLVYDLSYDYKNDPSTWKASHDRTLLLAPPAATDLTGIDTIVYNVTVSGVGNTAYFSDVEIDMRGFDGEVVINLIPADASITKYSFDHSPWGDSVANAKTTFTDESGEFYAYARKYSNEVFWNVPSQIQDLYMDSYKIAGSVIAQHSDFLAKSTIGAGNVNGNLIARNVDVHDASGWEAHNTADFGLLASEYPSSSGSISIFNEVLTITNTYEIKPAASTCSVVLEGNKTLGGKTLENGMFNFEVKDSSGTVVSAGTNRVDGSIAFEEITLTDPGAYTLTVSEVDTKQSGIIYDQRTYKVEVVVTKHDQSGELSATVTYQDGNVIFENLFEGKQGSGTGIGSTTPTTPETGDEGSIVCMWLLILASATCLLALFIRRKTQRHPPA